MIAVRVCLEENLRAASCRQHVERAVGEVDQDLVFKQDARLATHVGILLGPFGFPSGGARSEKPHADAAFGVSRHGVIRHRAP